MSAPTERVQLVKQESAALGGDAADEVNFLNSPIAPQEDAPEVAGVFFQDATHRDNNVLIWREGDDLKLADVAVPAGKILNDLLTPPLHDTIDQLVHEIAETSYLEITRDGNNLVSTVIYWTNSGKTTKVRESILSRDVNNLVNQSVEKQYNGSGALVQTLTTIFTRDVNNLVTSAALARS